MPGKFPPLPLITLSLLASACSSAPAGVDTPPTEFTPSHHVLLEGRVVNSAGQPLQGVEVGVPLALFASIPAERRVNAQGGTHTDATGAFSFLLGASSSRMLDGTADVYVFARKPGGSGQTLTIDSVLTPIRLVPVSQAPQILPVETLRLSMP